MQAGGYKTVDVLKCFPSAANGTSVTTPGVAGTFSAWVQMSAAFAVTARLGNIIAFPPTSLVAFTSFEVEIGVGSAGNEVTVGAIRGMYGITNSGGGVTAGDGGDFINFGAMADIINAGQRVCARVRVNSTNTGTWRISFQYWERPLTTGTQMPVAAIGPQFYPTGTSSLTTAVSSGAGAWGNGSWTAIIASTDTALCISHILAYGPQFVDWEIDIGTGSAGNETVRWTVKSRASWFAAQNAWQGGPWTFMLRPMFGPISPGTRISVRLRSSGGTATWQVSLGVTKQIISGAYTALVASRSNPAANFTSCVDAVGSVPPTSFGSWVTFLTTTNPIAIVGLTSTADDTGDTWVQIGTGSVGNESAVANILYGGCVVPGGSGGRFNYNLPIARIIPANTRVAIRIAIEDASGGATRWFGINYIQLGADGIPDFVNYTNDIVHSFYPRTSFTSGAGPWVNGSWVQLDASTDENIVITATGSWQNPTDVEYEIDFGYGTAGNEVVKGTFRNAARGDNSDSANTYDILPIPIIIPAGVRFCCRSRTSLAGAQTVRAAIHYMTEPPDPLVPVALSGIYKLVPQRRNDELYTAYDPVTTVEVAIPEPHGVTGFIGDEE